MSGEIPNQTIENLLEKWNELQPEERLEAFQQIPRDHSDDFFLNLSARDQAMLVLSLPEGQRRLWMRLLAPDDAADVIQVATGEERPKLLNLLDDSARREVSALLAYKEDAAGGLMSPRFARVRPEMTVNEAITYLRKQVGLVETIHYAYVLDAEQHLLGIATFRHLLSATPEKTVREIMRTEFTHASEDMDQEALANLFADRHLMAIPILDGRGRMKGIVTVDDIVDVVEEEASEDIQKIGGSEALDAPYLEVGFFSMVRKRAGWLSALFLGEMLTATAMRYFEAEISQAVVLALFIPLIISSGGNSGSQASTIVIRAMALGEVRLRDWWRVIRRELGAGLTLGLILGVIGLVRILVWGASINAYGQYYEAIAWTVSFSLIGVVLFGTIAGSMLPLLLRRLGFDPASASAPFIATLVDVTGVVIYFTVASVLLRGKLL
jgi:magnesium transporter